MLECLCWFLLTLFILLGRDAWVARDWTGITLTAFFVGFLVARVRHEIARDVERDARGQRGNP